MSSTTLFAIAAAAAAVLVLVAAVLLSIAAARNYIPTLAGPAAHTLISALGGFVRSVTVAVDVAVAADVHASPSTSPSVQPSPLRSYEAPAMKAANVKIKHVAPANVARIAHKTRVAACGRVPGRVEMPVRGMQCAVM